MWTGLCLAGKIFDTRTGHRPRGSVDLLIIRGWGGRERRVTNVMQWPEQNRILSIETPAGRENGFN